MTAAIAQMFAGGGPLNEDTVFDIEFTDEHVADGVYCQVQFSFTPLGGNDAIGVDWGDGTKQDWPKAQTLLAHNWDARGRYRVRFDRRLKWFRFTTAYAIDAATRRIRATVRPLVYPLQWGDFVESANGTYCGWRGVRGLLPVLRGTYGRLPEVGSLVHGLHGGVRRLHRDGRRAPAVA